MTKDIRPIHVEGSLAYVPLTLGHVAIVDVADVHLVSGHNWCAAKSGRTLYAVRTEGPRGKQRNIRMHRVILGDHRDLIVDHVDCNGLNNRRGNLRIATAAQNNQNQRMSKGNSSGFKGVTYDKDRGNWQAQIGLKGVNYHLGHFETPEIAHAAYIQASKKYHGEFGRT